ncbi:MAG: V-type ATPase subunit [Deinococcus sp.]|nr:V-type ATPase subunit [Deinococcus sp.]
MPDDYAYINTRVRMMRNALLDGRSLEAALAASSYPEFLRVLSESGFAASLRETTAEDAGLPELDRALSRNLFATTQKVLGFADGNSRREIETLLMRWDLVNLKTLARGVVAGRGVDAIRSSLIPGGTFKPSLLENAAGSSDLPGVASAISVSGHPLAAAFRRGVAAYQASGNLLNLEVALDQGYYGHVRKVAQDTSLRTYVGREIDITNALMARQAQAAGVPLNQEFFVPGGRLDAAGYARLASGDTGASPDIAAIMEAPTPQAAEVAARAALDRTARSIGVSDPMGVGIILDFLRRKEIEAAKLRLIGRGKYYGLPEEQLRQEVDA